MSIEKCKAELARAKDQTELKKRYNANLKRLQDGEKYFAKNGYDEHYYKYIELVKEMNVILRDLPDATDEEIDNGFKI